ncbi:uncharacterized protein LOC126778972 isoform X2 [Nymphalis io]|uniref:uncharacterized protein LOC126778972 isoform X2 n=1 Tax=Inachis io TaxID=171585 RepID=UPI002168E32E|nr:uncharacterized protein LOC126778972 isoform X2 [Nymphalis io]
MSLADVRSARSSPAPDACPECDTGASVTSDLHKYQVACTCKPASAQYACADDPGPPAPAKTDTPPALPPRPPTSVLAATNRRNNASVGCNGNETSCRRRKYAWWCCGCGALAAALGGLLAAQHILLRAYTASPHHLETVPAAVPAAMLVLTGVCIMSLARRRNRYSYMIKVVGACCLVCALTCVLVTITTTVIHMNKLQTLKFCEYTKLTRTCTCFSMSPDVQHSGSDDDGLRCVFEGVSDCGVVHGALYWCLRGVFALSVSAVLVCIFSCMLAYQLLSHERKKMYWEQLELRCRSLYRPPSGQPAVAAGRSVQNTCSCCTQCHPTQPAWDFSLQHRFWAPGRVGNLYSPTPGSGAGRKASPWSWLPWTRTQQTSRCRMSGVPQSGDSAYGFCETEQTPNPGQSYDERTYPNNFDQFQRTQNPANFTHNPTNFPQNSTNFPQTSANFVQSSANFSQTPSNFQGQFPQGSNFVQATSFPPGGFQEGFGEASGSFDAQTGVWGPPPPYSPQGRTASRHHLHHQDPAATTLLHHHHIEHRNSMPILEHSMPGQTHTCSRNYLHGTVPAVEMSRANELARMNPDMSRMNPEMSRLTSDMARMNPEMSPMYPREPAELARLQELERFQSLRVACRGVPGECLHHTSASKVSDQSIDSCPKQGKENLGFQNDKHSPMRASLSACVSHPAESEVYFADVSSCCNADCCTNAPVSLVGTIEAHPESTSESDSGSFTLSRQQRPQPQVGSKRRPRTDKLRQDFGGSLRLTEQQMEHLNTSMRIERVNDSRVSERMSDSRVSDRINDSRVSDRMNDSRVSDRMNDSRVSERMNDSRVSERMNDSRVSERLNESRISERMADIRMSDRMIDSRDRLNDSRIDRMNESRESRESRDRLNERVDRMTERDRLNDSDRMNDLRIDRATESRDRLNESRGMSERERLNESRLDRERPERASERRGPGPPRPRASPPRPRASPPRPRASPKPRDAAPALSPLSPATEESLMSDDDERRPETVYSNEPEPERLAPDSQYEPVRDGKDELKLNHHRCYSDTNTMDSGWQSGSEKQVTD